MRVRALLIVDPTDVSVFGPQKGLSSGHRRARLFYFVLSRGHLWWIVGSRSDRYGVPRRRPRRVQCVLKTTEDWVPKSGDLWTPRTLPRPLPHGHGSDNIFSFLPL